MALYGFDETKTKQNVFGTKGSDADNWLVNVLKSSQPNSNCLFTYGTGSGAKNLPLGQYLTNLYAVGAATQSGLTDLNTKLASYPAVGKVVQWYDWVNFGPDGIAHLTLNLNTFVPAKEVNKKFPNKNNKIFTISDAMTPFITPIAVIDGSGCPAVIVVRDSTHATTFKFDVHLLGYSGSGETLRGRIMFFLPTDWDWIDYIWNDNKAYAP